MSRQFYLLLTKWRGRTALCFIINLGYFKNNFGGLKSIQVAVVLVVTSLEGNDFFLIRNFLTPWGEKGEKNWKSYQGGFSSYLRIGVNIMGVRPPFYGSIYIFNVYIFLISDIFLIFLSSMRVLRGAKIQNNLSPLTYKTI